MADARHDEIILACLIGPTGTPERYRRALADVTVAVFVSTHRTLFEVVSRYYRVTGQGPDWPSFDAMVDGSDIDAGRKLVLKTDFARLWQLDPPEAHFRWSLREIRTQRRDERLTTALADGLKAMFEGVGGQQGYEAARQLLTEGLAEIDRHFEPRHPEGDIRLDGDAMRGSYEDAKVTRGVSDRMVRTGLTEIDSRIIGLRPGEGMLVAAYSSHGKTTAIQNVAWHACVVEAKNVLILTNENQYEQYRARIYNRHAHRIVTGGLRHNDIKTGSLLPQDEEHWAATIHDFSTNPAYGKLVVVQMPTGASMEWVLAQLDRFADEFDVGLVVLDYIGRMGAMTKRPTKRDELNDTLQLWASALVGFNRGQGVPGITGYQTSREKMNEAMVRGYYSLDCLAESSEAERNADVVLSMLRQEDVDNEVRVQLLKNRDGALLEPTSLVADWATTYIASGGGSWFR